jgi:hypothetical protein
LNVFSQRRGERWTGPNIQFAYLLGLRCAPAQVRRELHDLADRFAGYLRDV